MNTAVLEGSLVLVQSMQYYRLLYRVLYIHIEYYIEYSRFSTSVGWVVMLDVRYWSSILHFLFSVHPFCTIVCSTGSGNVSTGSIIL